MKKLAIIFALLTASTAQADCFSEGVRVGTIQKFSKKGTFVKSWEGELVMEGTKVSATATNVKGGNVWKFSVTDVTVAAAIDEATMSGGTVALKYCQVQFNAGSTDTNYIITKAVVRK